MAAELENRPMFRTLLPTMVPLLATHILESTPHKLQLRFLWIKASPGPPGCGLATADSLMGLDHPRVPKDGEGVGSVF